jgi:hypothetical protein
VQNESWTYLDEAEKGSSGREKSRAHLNNEIENHHPKPPQLRVNEPRKEMVSDEHKI